MTAQGIVVGEPTIQNTNIAVAELTPGEAVQGFPIGRVVGSEPGKAVALSTSGEAAALAEAAPAAALAEAAPTPAAALPAAAVVPPAKPAKPTTIVVVQDTAPAEEKKTKAVNIENLIDIKNITEIYFKNNHLEKIIEKFEKEEELLPPE